MKSTCYYCGAPKINYEHVPPRSFFSGRNYRPIKVPACSLHNNAKSGTDQAVLKAMLIPIATSRGTDWLKQWSSAYPECMAWLSVQQCTITYNMNATVAVPVRAERGMEDFPHLAHTKINFDRWIQAITAGIVYVVCGKRRLLSVDWDQARVICWDVMFRRRDDVPSTYDITTHGQWRSQTYANVHADWWFDGHLPNRYIYPVDHYRFRVGLSNRIVTIEHIFFNQYTFWCTFSPDQTDFNILFDGHMQCARRIDAVAV